MDERMPKNLQLWIEAADGKFVEIRPVAMSAKPKTIRCVPTPCRDGFHYVPDWNGLTYFG